MFRRGFIQVSVFLFIIASFFLCFSSFSQGTSDRPAFQVLQHNINGTIHGATVEILENVFKKAKEDVFDMILIVLDTPGGRLDSTEEIVKLFLNSNIPVVVYVGPSGAKAGSAGTFITMAANIASMAPGTYIGAAHPVSMFGGGGGSDEKENKQAQIMEEKIRSATSSFIESIAKQRGRNAKWAKKAVLDSDSITEDKAVKMNVIDLVAKNIDDLLKQIDGKTVQLKDMKFLFETKGYQIVKFDLEMKYRFLNWLASPTLIYLLILLVIGGLYLEFTNPGLILPGSAAAIALILLLFATQTLPINLFGILLILLSLGLMVAEIYVTSFGILTILSLGSFFAGSLFLFDPSKAGVSVPLIYIISSTAALAIIAFSVGFLIVKSSLRKPVSGREELIGMTAEVTQKIEAGQVGKVFCHSEYWNARSEESIDKGQKVEVVSSEGMMLYVKLKK